MLLYVHRNRTDSKGQGTQDGHLDFHTNSAKLSRWRDWPFIVEIEFTEIARTIRDREPRTATSTFTQLLSSAKLSCPRDWPFTVEMESRPSDDHVLFHAPASGHWTRGESLSPVANGQVVSADGLTARTYYHV